MSQNVSIELQSFDWLEKSQLADLNKRIIDAVCYNFPVGCIVTVTTKAGTKATAVTAAGFTRKEAQIGASDEEVVVDVPNNTAVAKFVETLVVEVLEHHSFQKPREKVKDA